MDFSGYFGEVAREKTSRSEQSVFVPNLISLYLSMSLKNSLAEKKYEANKYGRNKALVIAKVAYWVVDKYGKKYCIIDQKQMTIIILSKEFRDYEERKFR